MFAISDSLAFPSWDRPNCRGGDFEVLIAPDVWQPFAWVLSRPSGMQCVLPPAADYWGKFKEETYSICRLRTVEGVRCPMTAGSARARFSVSTFDL